MPRPSPAVPGVPLAYPSRGGQARHRMCGIWRQAIPG